MAERRVLILKFGAIGDVIMAIPAAYALYLSGNKIDWICGTTVAPVLQLYPWINLILLDDRALIKGGARAKLKVILSLWRTLIGRRYDLVATLYYDSRYRLLTLPARATRRIRLSTTDRQYRLLPGRHHTDEYERLLRDLPDQVRATPLAPVRVTRLPPSPLVRVPGRPRVVLAPAGARNLVRDDLLRRWPPELYVELTQLLLAQNVEVVLVGGPDDAWIQHYFESLAVIDLIGKLALPETLSLLDEADVLVTHDTGPLHLAGITRIRIVTIFGPTDPRGRLPQRPGALALWGGEGFACRPCYDGHTFAPCPSNDCMRQVKPPMVAKLVLQMLQDQAGGILPPPRVLTPESTVPAERIL